MGTCASRLSGAHSVASKRAGERQRRRRGRGERAETPTASGGSGGGSSETVMANARLLFSWETAPLLFDPASSPLFSGKYSEEAAMEAARLHEVAPTYDAACLPPHSVFLRLPGEIRGERISAYENSRCMILLFDHCDSVSLHECDNCFIFIGPTSGSVFIERCRNCLIVGCCAQLRLRGCRQLQLSISVATIPVLEESTGIGVCSLSGWFVYPLMPLHMQRAGLSMFNNFYTMAHDFTPKAVSTRVGRRGCTPSRTNGNLYYIHQDEFEKFCWMLWRRDDEEVRNDAMVDMSPGGGGVTVDHKDVKLTVPTKEGEEVVVKREVENDGIQGLPTNSSVISCPLVVLLHNSGRQYRLQGMNNKANPLAQLPLGTNDLAEMFHHTVVVPVTFGASRVLPHTVVSGKWQPRLFAVTTGEGGASIAMRIVRDIELSRRRAFIDRMQKDPEREVDIDGDVMLLNTVELSCTEPLVREHIMPDLQKMARTSFKNDPMINQELTDAIHRMTGSTCIFLLALLRPDTEAKNTVQEAQSIFSFVGASSSPSACARSNSNNNNNGDKDGGGDSSSSRASPSPRPPRSSENIENTTTWKKSVLLNIPFPMEHVNALQSSIFLRAPTAGSGIGSAFD